MLVVRTFFMLSACVCLEGCYALPLGNVFNGTFIHGEPVIGDRVWLLASQQPGKLKETYLPPPCAPDTVTTPTDAAKTAANAAAAAASTANDTAPISGSGGAANAADSSAGATKSAAAVASGYENWSPNQIKACVYAMRQLIDVRFYHYQDSILAAESGGTTAADLAIVGMGAAGGLIGGTTSQILSAASGAVAGAEAKINNDVLRSKSIEIILQQMDADRAIQGTIIDERLHATDPDPVEQSGNPSANKTNNQAPANPVASRNGSRTASRTASPNGRQATNQPQSQTNNKTGNGQPYTDMYDAANDLYKYARAGSWTHAILALQAQAGAQAHACARAQNYVHVGRSAPGFSLTTGQSADAENNCPLMPPNSGSS